MLVVELDELARNRDLCDLLLRGGDDFDALDRVDKARFRFHLMGFMRRFENAYMQHKIGTLEESNWGGLRSTLDSVLSSPGSRSAWPLIKSRMNPEFRDYIDGYVERAVAAASANPAPPAPTTHGKTNQRRKR
jgi:hypothetical protein